MVLIFLVFPSCRFNNDAALEQEKGLMQMHVDSLWVQQKSVQGLFRLKLDELESRKTEMGKDLQALRFADGAWLSAEEKDNIVKWEAMYRIYKGMDGRYKSAVASAEAHFYTVKSMDKMVKNGSYSGKKEEFKQLYAKTHRLLTDLLLEATAIDKELTAIEPTYQRLEEPMIATMEKVNARLAASKR